MTTSWRAPALIWLLVAGLYLLARPQVVDALGAGHLAIGVGAGALLVSLVTAGWQARRRRYACPGCGHVFGASTLGSLAGQDWYGRLHTGCPACGERHGCDPVLDAGA